MRRSSPLTGRPSISSDIFCERSPSATASSTRDTSIVGRTRSSISELTESIASPHEPVTLSSCARSVILPSRRTTLLTRFSSSVSASRRSASWLKALATSPMTPPFCALSRTPASPSLADRRASSKSWRSRFGILIVPFAARFRRDFVSPAATADSFRATRLGAENLTRAQRNAWNWLGVVRRRPQTDDVVDDDQRRDEHGGEEGVGDREVDAPTPRERGDTRKEGSGSAADHERNDCVGLLPAIVVAKTNGGERGHGTRHEDRKRSSRMPTPARGHATAHRQVRDRR